jgi:hypothetical protein
VVQRFFGSPFKVVISYIEKLQMTLYHLHRKVTYLEKILLIAVSFFLFNSTVLAGDGLYRKAKRHKEEFSEMGLYIISKGYHRNFINHYLYIPVETIEDKRIKKFCKKFNIYQLTIQGNYDYQGKSGRFVEDSVIIFERNYIPFFGARHEIIIDCSTVKKDYPDFAGYGQKRIKIEKGMYYFRH